ncbi:hypothetical protein [Amycolatopsis sp. MJM2582]|uniref:hypothetical protein n=1 Tax=Amycolatopsis sp. MJM2582 TaxID=1427749 RepID=UPI001F30A9ED|nr:hypothetical protein [Amycolatopsis sp. MJM2582]
MKHVELGARVVLFIARVLDAASGSASGSAVSRASTSSLGFMPDTDYAILSCASSAVLGSSAGEVMAQHSSSPRENQSRTRA